MGLPRVNGEIAKLWKDPELKFTPAGKAVCELALIFVKRQKNRDTGAWEDAGQMWVRGAVWDQMAENCAESLSKGDEVLVTGELSVREFERKDGSKGQSTELRVWEIGPSLRWSTAKVARADRGNAHGASGTGGGAPVDDPWSAAGDDTGAPF